jgi:predicted nucleic acid-binding protein
MCGMIELELLYGARNFEAGRQLLEDIRLRFETVPTIQADFDRAAAVMLALSRAGQHRSAALPDLLIAAVAERRGLAIIHYDQDFDRISEITGQPVTWVVPRGTI